MKFGHIVYNHNQKVKFEDGLCQLILKATAIKKKPWEIMKISHYKCERNKGSNYPLILHRKHNTETDIKQSLPYGTAPGIEC